MCSITVNYHSIYGVFFFLFFFLIQEFFFLILFKFLRTFIKDVFARFLSSNIYTLALIDIGILHAELTVIMISRLIRYITTRA